MNNPNLQIQKIIYQSQCTYLYWYVFLNFLAINDIFPVWNGKQLQLLQLIGDELLLIEKNDVEPEEEDGSLGKGDDLQPVRKDELNTLPLENIIVKYPELPSPLPLEEGIMLPKNAANQGKRSGGE